MEGREPAKLRRELQFRRGIFAFARHYNRDFPWRETRDPYVVLIGCVLLQRTTGAHVHRVFNEFMERWPTFRELALAEEEEVGVVLHPLGLANRTRRIIQLGRDLNQLGTVPLTPKALLELPGVGRYSAHAVPIFATNRNLPLVDWVIARVLRRYFGLSSSGRPNSDEELWSLAGEIARTGRARAIWLGTLDLANTFCLPRPKCRSCPLQMTCCHAKGDVCDHPTNSDHDLREP